MKHKELCLGATVYSGFGERVVEGVVLKCTAPWRGQEDAIVFMYLGRVPVGATFAVTLYPHGSTRQWVRVAASAGRVSNVVVESVRRDGVSLRFEAPAQPGTYRVDVLLDGETPWQRARVIMVFCAAVEVTGCGAGSDGREKPVGALQRLAVRTGVWDVKQVEV